MNPAILTIDIGEVRVIASSAGWVVFINLFNGESETRDLDETINELQRRKNERELSRK
jgi:hypothetical protein